MSVSIGSQHCHRCGGQLAVDPPHGLCPMCLLLQASIPTQVGQQVCDGSPPPSLAEMQSAFPHLEILDLIGKGGMGYVFKARQPKLDRFVALKILPQSLGADSGFAERFAREGRLLARLNHPNIVTVHDFGEADGFFYLLMEFVEGVTLRQSMRAGRLTPVQALAIVPGICDALQFAHDKGVLHRDIKPENILLDSKGHVKIADFGIGKLLADKLDTPAGTIKEACCGTTIGDPRVTEAGNVLGTPEYMAPEQRECPGNVDQRADIYSLGVVFYEMLTGELPIGRFLPPSARCTSDPRLDDVVLRALEKERERRTGTAVEVKTQVENITQPLPAQSSSKNARRIGVLLACVVAACLLVLGGTKNLTRFSTGATVSKPGTMDIAAEMIKNEIGRQIRETGATYDDIKVSVAANVDSGTPFNVAYRGLENFVSPDGNSPGKNGQFAMQWIGAGQWQGSLGGRVFTVVVGSRNDTNLPFETDPQVLGEWKSVDFVDAMADFNPQQPRWKGKLLIGRLTFLERGVTSMPAFSWTKGRLIHQGDKTVSQYHIREFEGRRYLFFEWKSGDVTIAGQKPWYYVMKKES